VCGGGLDLVDGGAAVRCADGHRADVARQGWVTLAHGPIRHPGDTSEMVAARARVHAARVLDAVVAAVVAALPQGVDAVADVGGGTGAYAAAAVAAGRARRAVVLDSSRPALRRAVRAGAGVAAVGCDLVAGIPLRDASVDAALVAFAPRHAAELARVVRPGGALVVATPEPGHLAPLVEPLGMLRVGAGKAAAAAAQLAGAFDVEATAVVRDRVAVDRTTAADLAQMGPAGFHATRAELEARAAALADPVDVHLAVAITDLTRRPG
jgi:23S rRNA (guanine745-N1)-methyltransferase